MTKAVVQVGYNKYVLETKDALTLLDILAKAERYREKWKRDEEGGTTYHVWNQPTSEVCNMQMHMLPDELYKMAKLAGEPADG